MIQVRTRTSEEPFNFADGELLLIDKPSGWTSFDVVNKLRFLIGTKAGHAGTLDPLATGLLIIGTGKATKKLTELQGLDKGYSGTIELGAVTPSFDAETEVSERKAFDHLTEAQLEKARDSFLGKQEQIPPIYSAIKVKGKRLYKEARKGNAVVAPPRQVEIFDFQLGHVELPLVSFEVQVSKGTYIRSLANDFGHRLDVGGYLSSLRRISVGEYKIEDAWALDKLIERLQDYRSNNTEASDPKK